MRKAFTFHHDERAKQRFFRRFAPGFGVRITDWAQIQVQKQLIVKFRLGLRDEQADVLYDFLSIDNGQLLCGMVFVATELYHI